MKNACILLRQDKNSLLEENLFKIDKIFSSCGYAFEEIRILLSTDRAKIFSTLEQWKREYENIVVLCAQNAIPEVKKHLTESFPEDVWQGSVNGIEIAMGAKGLCFLLATDRGFNIADHANVCVSYLNNKYKQRIDKYVVCTVGANEEYVKKLVIQAKNCSEGRMFFRHIRKFGEDRIEIYYDGNTPKMLVDDIIRMFAEGLEDCIYALGEDITLEEQLVRLLKLRGRKLSVAESFTGGGVGRRIVSVSGASAVYFEGLNTYDSLSKMKRLGVSEYTLNTVGAVSDQTAYEMATGLLQTKNCDISIATTGIAGPKSDKSMLPVGLCYIAIGTKERVYVYRYIFDGHREDVIETGINYALFHAYKQLKSL